MNKQTDGNGIKVSVIGPVLYLDGKKIDFVAGASLEDIKEGARVWRKHGRNVALKREIVRTYIEPATTLDSDNYDEWHAWAHHEDDDGTRLEMHPWDWKIVGQATEDTTR
jgi:hypothetical protein